MSFFWGVATSSHQIEGGNARNDWWAWEQAGNIETGETSGLATDHWHRSEIDLRNAASLGLNSYRFSLEWSRLEPEEGKWDKEAFAWYESLITRCENLGLTPMVTLHHFTLPKWLADKGGLTHSHFADRFAGYVRKVIAAFGPRVPLWCTVNEPMLLAVCAYLSGSMPPAQSNLRNLALAHRGLLKAHVAAYHLLHGSITQRQGPWKDIPLAVGFAHNMIDFQPLRAFSLRERLLTAFVNRYYNQSWLDAVTGRRQHFGIPGLLPAPKQVWGARAHKTVDFIGVNYYTRAYLCWGPQKELTQFIGFRNLPLGIRFERAGDTLSDLGWAIRPEGMAKVLRQASKYKVPLYITENGIADAQDKLRPQFLLDHVREVAKARESGIDIRGYYHWSLLDNFEWVKGFTPRFGLWEVDYKTFERRPRPSAELYSKIIAAMGGDPRVEKIAGLSANTQMSATQTLASK